MMRGSAATWVARRLPFADDEHREELAASVASLVADRPRCERAREAASLVGLWLRLWGRREGLDDARQAVRQGVYLGGVLLAMVSRPRRGAPSGSTGSASRARSPSPPRRCRQVLPSLPPEDGERPHWLRRWVRSSPSR